MRIQEQSIRAERKTEQSGPKSQMTGTEGESEKNERNAERDVEEWERSGEGLNLPLMLLKPVVLCMYSALFRGEAWPRP